MTRSLMAASEAAAELVEGDSMPTDTAVKTVIVAAPGS